jgi:hypothetical protein
MDYIGIAGRVSHHRGYLDSRLVPHLWEPTCSSHGLGGVTAELVSDVCELEHLFTASRLQITRQIVILVERRWEILVTRAALIIFGIAANLAGLAAAVLLCVMMFHFCQVARLTMG